MPDRLFKLESAPAAPIIETVSGSDDDEARDLAMIRLMAASEARLVEVWDRDRWVGRHVRDSARNALSRPRGACVSLGVDRVSLLSA